MFFILLLILSCKTTTEPIIYDKDLKTIDKESELIHILIRNGNFDEAEKQIDKNLILYPDNPDILLLKGWLFLELDKLTESEEIFNSLLEKNKKNALALTGISIIYRIKGDKKNALEKISEALRYLPSNSNLWLEKGILEYEEKNFKKALQYFTKAYALDINNIEAFFYKYITMLQLDKDIIDIYNIWEKIIKNNEFHSWFFQYHAEVLYNKNKKSLAFQLIKEGLSNFPNDPFLLNMHSYYLFKEYLVSNDEKHLNDAYDNILICIKDSGKISPEFIDTYFLILEKKGDIEKIQNDLQKYILLFPNSEVLKKWIKKY
jgi:tetratricopeptide (TPR) repeat protein